MSVSKNKMAEDYDDSVKGEPTFTIAGLDLSIYLYSFDIYHLYNKFHPRRAYANIQ